MNLVSWDSSYSVQVRQFDEQHKTLFAMLNRLHEAMGAGQGQRALAKLLEELIRYTKTHFDAEEAVLQANRYPDLERHQAEHAKLAAEVARFQRDFAAGAVGLSVEVMDFLQRWLRQHILESDKRYSTFLLAKGLA
jgi:hemerythrin-like metal-binding protein